MGQFLAVDLESELIFYVEAAAAARHLFESILYLSQ